MDSQFKSLKLPEVIVFTPNKIFDNRGFFYENFNSNFFAKNNNFIFEVLQENISFSKKNVLRGLHFQKGKHAQSKLIQVLKGKILDVIVDIRPHSKNFGKWVSYILDDKENQSIFIPNFFAHGFLVLSDNAQISYKVDKLYNFNSECSILWNDKNIMIDWPIKNPILSEKDSNAISLHDNLNNKNFIKA